MHPPGLDFLSINNVMKVEALFCTSIVKEESHRLCEKLVDYLESFLRSWESVQTNIDNSTKNFEQQKKKAETPRQLLLQRKNRVEQKDAEFQDKQNEVKKDQRQNARLLETICFETEQSKPELAQGMETEEQNELEWKEKQAELVLTKQRMQEMFEEINREKIEIEQDDETLDCEEMALNEARLQEVKKLSARKKDVLDKLCVEAAECSELMVLLRKTHNCKFLTNLHTTPGVAAAQEFLRDIQSQFVRIDNTGKKVTFLNT
jgi:hypothetical protein